MRQIITIHVAFPGYTSRLGKGQRAIHPISGEDMIVEKIMYNVDEQSVFVAYRNHGQPAGSPDHELILPLSMCVLDVRNDEGHDDVGKPTADVG
jgi:hypothetical protein